MNVMMLNMNLGKDVQSSFLQVDTSQFQHTTKWRQLENIKFGSGLVADNLVRNELGHSSWC
jgi:hypothetical protein